MDPITLAAIVGPQVLGGVIGNQQARSDEERMRRLMQQGYDQFAQIGLPEYQDIGYLPLENYDQMSQFTPEYADLVQVGPSEMQGISLDPNLRAAQLRALDQLGQVSESGMTDIDRARLAEIQSQTDTASRGQREAIMQNMQTRGISGSGLELMAQLQNQQAAASQANMGGLKTAADAQTRALDAIYNRANLAGQMENQEFQQQAQKAQAQDAISRMNADFRLRNTENRANTSNDAQLRNQALMQQQIDARNKNMTMNQFDVQNANNQLQTQRYQDQIQRAGGMSGQLSQQAGMANQNAQNTRQMYSDIGQGLGQGAATYYANKPKTTTKKPGEF